jgi:hypothetical protein
MTRFDEGLVYIVRIDPSDFLTTHAPLVLRPITAVTPDFFLDTVRLGLFSIFCFATAAAPLTQARQLRHKAPFFNNTSNRPRLNLASSEANFLLDSPPGFGNP